MSLDDQDVSQLLPVRGDQFVQGVSPSSSRNYHVSDVADTCTSSGKAMGTVPRSSSLPPRKSGRFFHPLHQGDDSDLCVVWAMN